MLKSENHIKNVEKWKVKGFRSECCQLMWTGCPKATSRLPYQVWRPTTQATDLPDLMSYFMSPSSTPHFDFVRV